MRPPSQLFRKNSLTKGSLRIKRFFSPWVLLLYAIIYLPQAIWAQTQLVTNGLLGCWHFDEAANASAWKPLSAYTVGQTVLNDGGNLYTCTTSGTSSASGGPTGTNSAIQDNNVIWSWYSIIKGYDANGHNPNLDSAPISASNQPYPMWPGWWQTSGYKAANQSEVQLAYNHDVMNDAQTVFVVSDVDHPNNVLLGNPGLVGTGTPVGSGGSYNGYKEQYIDAAGRPSTGGSSDPGWYTSVQVGTIPLLRVQGVIATTFVYGADDSNATTVYYGSTPQRYYLSRGAPNSDNPLINAAVINWDGAYGFVGSIYYLAVYNRALSAAEVAQNVGYVQSLLSTRGSGITLGDTIPATQPLMVFQGDSITFGYGSTNVMDGWAHQVARSLNGSYRDINAGLPGISVCPDATGLTGYYNFGPAEVDPLFRQYGSPYSNVAVIFLGANDLFSGTSANSIEQYLTDRVAKVQAAGASQVILCTLLPRWVGLEGQAAESNLETTVTEVNNYIRANAFALNYSVADFGADPMLDNYSNTVNDPTGSPDSPSFGTLWYTDGAHPTQLGHEVLALIMDQALVGIGIDTNKLTFGSVDSGWITGTSSGTDYTSSYSSGYPSYYNHKTSFEATDCYNPNKKLEDSPTSDAYVSVLMTHQGPLAIGLHTDKTTDTGLSGVNKPEVAYYLCNTGLGYYDVGGSMGGWGPITLLAPQANDVLRLRRTPIAPGDSNSLLYAEVSQDGGHTWNVISSISYSTTINGATVYHGNLPSGDLYPRLMSSDSAMTPVVVKCNGATANVVSPTWAAAPSMSAPVTGTPTTVMASIESSGPVDYTYQWLLNGLPINNATSSTYTPTTAQLGQTLSVFVTANTANGTTSSYAIAPTGRVISPPNTPDDTPLPWWVSFLLATGITLIVYRQFIFRSRNQAYQARFFNTRRI